MSMTYKELQLEVSRRATRNQGGDQYTDAIKNVVNSSLFRICREAYWRQFRRRDVIRTVTSYTTGSGSATATTSGTTVTVAGATFLTDDVQINRRVKISGDSRYFYIREVTGETSFVMDYSYEATTTTAATYEILPQSEYNLPIQCGHRMFMYHEDYGYPLKMAYIVDQDFFTGSNLTEKNVPTMYRMWGENMAIRDVLTPTTMAVFSSSSNDTTQDVTIFGMAGGYPESETIRVNGASVVTGTTTFTKVDRITKNSNTVGRVSIAASGNTSTEYAVIPKGDITSGIQYRKIQIYPLPTRAFDMHIQYYKEPYRLVNDNDVHELGQEFDEAIILLSVAKVTAETHQTEAAGFLALYADEIKSLKKTNVDKIDHFPTLRSPNGNNNAFIPGVINYNQFGSNYGPSGRY